MTSDHLDISFVWKSVVASCVCVCVAEVRTRVFNVFVSSAKRVRLQRQRLVSRQAQNAFVAIAISAFVCSVISHSEVSSKGYLVASNERICMQCDIVLGGK